MAPTIIFLLVNTICIIVFVSIGIYAWNKETPMWFYSGSEEKIEKETFTDIKAYNHRNGVMWIVYGIAYLIPIVLQSLLNEVTFLIVFLFISVGGFIMMIIYYQYIYKKYTQKTSL